MAVKGKSSKLSIAWRGIAVLLLSLAIVFTSLVAAPVMAQETAVTVTVNASVYVVEGGTFVATIDVDSVTELNSAYFHLSFDKNVVKVSDVKDGKIDSEDVLIMWNVNPDKDTVGVVMEPIEEGISGSGYLAKIEFDVKGGEGEKSELKFSEGELARVPEGEYVSPEKIPANWINTTITIGVVPTPEEDEDEDEDEAKEEKGEEGEPTPSPSPTATPETNVTVTPSPTPTLAPGMTPGPTPALAPEVTPSPTVTPTVKPTLAPATTPSPGPMEKPTPTPPGFEVVLAIAVLSAIAYILLKKEK
jgi:hypothetical protein